ncbi:alpha/beta fold hydrolase [Chryseobacterium sp. CH21]|uniref:alpha/beta fold hydrolase n=1 Tax=Chryseobacterium sp. CH21 TaxID=713556 RepID=UPI001E547093|nr:alpha/beta hydrolase [Chryseobacterium sp. CH21]
MLFIPGFASSGDVWNETTAKFEKNFTCYTLTMAGFAGTKPQSDASFKDWEKGIADYIKNNKIDKPIIIGHSMGGGLALAIAADYSELVGKIIVVDALPCLAAMANPNFASKENIDFKNIWKQQTSNKPNMDELLGKLKKFRNQNLRRLIFANIGLIATSLVILFIWYRYQPQMITTKIGIVLVILGMAIFLLAYNKMFMVFYKIDQTQSNNEYLQSLYVVKRKQKLMQTTILNLYFIMLFLGICFYMYEYTSRMTLGSGILTYAVTSAWIAFNWFYLRPKTIKKQERKLDELINKFEEINNQLKES